MNVITDNKNMNATSGLRKELDFNLKKPIDLEVVDS